MNYILWLDTISLFLLIDFFNGINNNPIGRILKRTFFVVLFYLFISTLFFLVASQNISIQNIFFVTIICTIVCVVFAPKLFRKTMNYCDVENNKLFFENQKVIFIVPHEDDEINLAGGVIEQYIKNGSTVYIVFSTNGDSNDEDIIDDPQESGRIRMRESISALTSLGVKEDNIILLGYGDRWDTDGPHIYNADEGCIIQSRAGNRKTYGLASHLAYRDGQDYTIDNYHNDLKSVIIDIEPDTIYCIDYDTHEDHRALSMIFEKIMGEILSETDYQPTVYKGYAYRTSWFAPDDYQDSINLESTTNYSMENDVVIYDWEKRERVSVLASELSRHYSYSRFYDLLAHYESQKAENRIERIVNGDKVFWERRTDSLCYKGNYVVSSGNASKLNDFMLLDCDDLIGNGAFPYDGVWHPSIDDSERTASFCFHELCYVDHISLYDSPDIGSNIINAMITTNEGDQFASGKLQSNGGETKVIIQKVISGFTVKIDEFEGDNYGITEIEAFSKPDSNKKAFYKIVDDKGNFAYDYIVPNSGKQLFKVYSNKANMCALDGWKVRSSHKRCNATICNDTIIIECKKGIKSIVELFDEEGMLCDRVLIRNPNEIQRTLIRLSVSAAGKGTINKTIAHRIFLGLKTFD